MEKQFNLAAIFFCFIASLALLYPDKVFADDFGGNVVEVEGNVTVTSRGGDKKTVVDGFRIKPGDTVETASASFAEIHFDDGNVTVMDENSRLTIKTLSTSKGKGKQSVIGLSFGKIKNSVVKLVRKKSKFEVHTKSSVMGVTGTPPWVVGAFPSKTGGKFVTEVDLLGKPGDKGGVFVRGSDPKSPEVILKAGTRTIVEMGMPPVSPFAIDMGRFQNLNTLMPLRTLKGAIERKKSADKASEHQLMDLVNTHITRQLSLVEDQNPGESITGEETESQLSLGDNQITGTGEGATPTGSRLNIRVNIDNR